MLAPQCVAVDDKDNIYVTDSESGKIFVFNCDGKYQRAIGSLKGGEGFFKRPTGIAVDSAEQRIYVTDTLRNKIFVLDMSGNVPEDHREEWRQATASSTIPPSCGWMGRDLVVVDAMNFRVQLIDRSGQFQYAIGKIGDGRGEMFRPKGIGVDSEGHLYVVEASSTWCRCSTAKASCCITSGRRGRASASSGCPPACSLTAMIACIRGGFLQSPRAGVSVLRAEAGQRRSAVKRGLLCTCMVALALAGTATAQVHRRCHRHARSVAGRSLANPGTAAWFVHLLPRAALRQGNMAPLWNQSSRPRPTPPTPAPHLSKRTSSRCRWAATAACV